MKRLWIMGTVMLFALSHGISSANAGIGVWRWLGLGFGPGYHSSAGGHHGHHGHYGFHHGMGNGAWGGGAVWNEAPVDSHPGVGTVTNPMPSVSQQPTPAVPQYTPPKAASAPRVFPWQSR